MERPEWVEINGKRVRVTYTDTGRGEYCWTGKDGHEHWTVWDENGTRTLDLTLAERLLA